MSIEYMDRRGGNKKEQSTSKEMNVTSPETKKERFWENVAYIVLLSPLPNGQTMVLGRAAGIRSDGPLFVADYILPSAEYPADLFWQHEAMDRLETFLYCDCESQAPCINHRYNIPQWVQADLSRLKLMNSKPLSRALEVMLVAERAGAKKPNGVVIPG